MPKTVSTIAATVNALLVSKLPVSEYAHGFLGGHSVRIANRTSKT